MKKYLITYFILSTVLIAEQNSARNRLFPQGAAPLHRRPVLLEIEKQTEILSKLKATTAEALVDTPLIPNRVYLVFSQKEERWLWQLTDFEGYLPDPPEALRTLSVISGKLLGAKDPNQRYLLSFDKAIWVPTFQKEQLFVWVYAKAPKPEHIRIVSIQSKK